MPYTPEQLAKIDEIDSQETREMLIYLMEHYDASAELSSRVDKLETQLLLSFGLLKVMSVASTKVSASDNPQAKVTSLMAFVEGM